VFDGVFLLRHELIDCWDFSVFVAVPFAETVRRAAVRDLALLGSQDEVLHRYAVRYVAGQQLYVELKDPQAKANVVFENMDPANPRLRIRGSS
jgi:uridine kinase